MRWTGVFGYLATVVLATVLVSRWLGWTGSLVATCLVLVLPLVVVLARNTWPPFRWSSALALLSGLALLSSPLCQYAGWIQRPHRLALLWAVSPPALAIAVS